MVGHLCRILWAFDIVSLKDETGRDILPSRDDFKTGLISRPKPFGYMLIPRSKNVSKVVTAEAEGATAEATAWE
jgi:hypothetical protein